VKQMNSVRHLAIIMDGNGRWAEQRGMPRWKGHESGVQTVRRIAEAACRLDIPLLTLFAFSSENWRRPAKEVQILFNLFYRYLLAEKQSLLKNEIRISAFGRRDRLPRRLCAALRAVEDATRNCGKLHLRIAMDYGARHEIVEAARSLACDCMRQKISPEQITEHLFAERLSRDAVPDPDLIVRTAGEQRISNFLLWQAAYSELYFSPKTWPDFDVPDLEEALAQYRSRTRKFGALTRATGTAG
jgi:undecaprenyl diphosphate synthase